MATTTIYPTAAFGSVEFGSPSNIIGPPDNNNASYDQENVQYVTGYSYVSDLPVDAEITNIKIGVHGYAQFARYSTARLITYKSGNFLYQTPNFAFTGANSLHTFDVTGLIEVADIPNISIRCDKLNPENYSQSVDTIPIIIEYTYPGEPREETLSVSEDTFVSNFSSSSMDTNYATSIAITYGVNGATTYNSYFNLPTPVLSEGESISGAKLTLYNRYVAKTAGTVQLYKPNASWTETTITWNNQPSSTFIKDQSVPSTAIDQAYEVDLTGIDLTNGISLRKAVGEYYQIHSSEYVDNVALRPTITYTIATPTGPAGPTAQYYNGTSWVPATVQIFNGTSWAPTKLTGYTP